MALGMSRGAGFGLFLLCSKNMQALSAKYWSEEGMLEIGTNRQDCMQSSWRVKE